MNIVFLDTQTMGNVSNLNLLEKYGTLTLYSVTKADEAFNRLQHADIAITCKVIIDKPLMQKLPKLKLICVAATGTNNIDIEYAKSAGIKVMNVAGYSTNSVAQATFAMLLALMNQTNYYDNYVKSGQYCHNDMFTHIGRPFSELNGKQFGIIGLGNIGLKVAAIAEAFGCSVCYYSTSGQNKNPKYKSLSLSELLSSSDIISIHAPLNENTRNLLTISQLKTMKRNAILVNMARGGIVNEADLALALNQNLIAGACTDVFLKEPIEKDNPLFSVTNKDKLILAPHSAWTSIEARTKLIEMIGENIEVFLKQ